MSDIKITIGVLIIFIIPLFFAGFALIYESICCNDNSPDILKLPVGLLIYTITSIGVEKLININWLIDTILYIGVMALMIFVSLKTSLKVVNN